MPPRALAVPSDDPLLLAVIALANPEVTAPSVRRRVARIRPQEMTDPVAAMYVGIAAEKAGDFAGGSRFLGRAVERLRAQGRLGPLTQALVHYAWSATYAGDWEGAERGRLPRRRSWHATLGSRSTDSPASSWAPSPRRSAGAKPTSMV